MQAFVTSATDAAIRIVPNSMDCDAALIWSVLWSGRMKPNRRVYEHYRSQGRPVIIADVGALHRGVTWKVALNHLTAQGYYGHTQNLDPDRPRLLNVTLTTNAHHGDAILLACQHDSSLQVQDTGGMQNWIQQQIDLLRQHTDRRIVIRPHPRSTVNPRPWRGDRSIRFEQPRPRADTYDDFDLHFNYHAVVNHNSGVGIKSVLAGVRTMVDSSSLAHPASISIEHLEQAYEADRQQWLIEICHTEYTTDEITQGLWLKRLREKL
jgi:hypothetical protein